MGLLTTWDTASPYWAAVTAEHIPEFKDLVKKKRGGNNFLINFICIICYNNVLAVLGKIKYIIKINFTYLFLLSLMWLREI